MPFLLLSGLVGEKVEWVAAVLAGLAGMMVVTRRAVRAGLKSNHGNNESKNSRLFCILQDKIGEEPEQPVGDNSKALLS